MRKKNESEEGAWAISFACPSCGRELKPKSELAGRKIKCGKCGAVALVPALATSDPPRAARRIPRLRVLIAALVGVGLLFSAVGAVFWVSALNRQPYRSRIQNAADLVKALQTDTIDAREFPMLADLDLECLHDLPNLKHLNLDHTQVTDAGMKNVARVPSLLILSLTNTQVTDAGLAALKPIAGLEDLRLDKLPITDVGLSHVRAFPQLRKLSLYQTRISDAGLDHLKSLVFLERLSLDDTDVSDDGIRRLSELANLRFLSVWKTKVTDAGAQKLHTALPSLKINK